MMKENWYNKRDSVNSVEFYLPLLNCRELSDFVKGLQEVNKGTNDCQIGFKKST